MTTPSLVEPRLVYSSLDGLLEHRLCQMVPTFHTRTRIAGASRRRKDILPCPCLRRAWRFPFACIRSIHLTKAFEPIGLMQQVYSLQMSREPRLYRRRQHGARACAPFPSCPVIWWEATSTSFTRRRTHSIKRTPAPYSKLALRCGMLLRWASTHETSSRVNTTGTCRGLFARSIFPSSGKSCLSTAR